ncbi:Aspartyl protease family protein [Thalictrum thalictroides]|uniref:Aspartyl protease family protein n=1 Tax=Thalictrum thalictroides TaxID=46969 RepID=A0A7J6X522_THATH|nr:Aspartyl protease family protein [Thalictrum thalictroides]
MEEGRIPKTTLLAFFFIFLFSTSFSTPLQQHQTLIVVPFSNPPTLKPVDDLSWSESQTSESLDFQNTLSLPLQHIDALSVNETSESLFHLRLQRDELRVKTLTSLTTTTAGGGGGHHRNGNNNATRANAKDFSSSIVSGLPQGSGEYFTRIGVGTPPKYSYMVLDTGSDIVWLQCAPCRKCYSQTDPIFDPKNSQSFSGVPCGSPLCRKLDVSGCNTQRKSCLYQVNYGDGSFTVGEYATETLTFRGTKVGNVGFGCGHDNEGLFVGAAGLLGLGRGGLSFPTQTGRRFGNKFSYCLVDRSSISSKASAIVFGESSIPRSAVFTPMVTNPKLNTFYYLDLVGVSVGGTRVPGISSTLFRLDAAGNGGVIIDSGTSVTRLTRPAYEALRDAFRSGAAELKRAPGFSLFDTCFDLSGKTEVKVPTVVMHFGRGADVSLPASNYLIPINSNGVFCFAFAGTTSGLSIIGNIQQQGFRIVFDNAGSRIGFAPRGCA